MGFDLLHQRFGGKTVFIQGLFRMKHLIPQLFDDGSNDRNENRFWDVVEMSVFCPGFYNAVHSGQFFQYLHAQRALPGSAESYARPGPLPLRPGEIVEWVLNHE